MVKSSGLEGGVDGGRTLGAALLGRNTEIGSLRIKKAGCRRNQSVGRSGLHPANDSVRRAAFVNQAPEGSHPSHPITHAHRSGKSHYGI